MIYQNIAKDGKLLMNTGILRNILSLILAVLLLAGSIPAEVFAAGGSVEEICHLTASVEMGQLVIRQKSTETVQMSAADSVRTASASDLSEYLSVNEGAEELRKQMKSRTKNIHISVKSQDYVPEELYQELLSRALAHTGVPDEGDYILYHMQTLELSYSARHASDAYYVDLNYTIQYRTTAAQEKTVNTQLATVMSKS